MTLLTSRRFLSWLAPLALLLVAAFMHLYLLNSYPPGIDSDAAHDGLDALKPLDYNIWPFYIVINSNTDPTYIYTAALGNALLGERAFTLRFAGIIYALTGLAATYTCLRELGRGSFDSRFRVIVAFFGVAALATSQAFTFFNRMGLRFVTQLPFEMLAIWALARAVRTGNRTTWLLAGLLAAATQYTYPAARLLPIFLLLVLIFKALQERPTLKNFFSGFGVYAVGVFAGLLPQLIWYGIYPNTLLARAGQTAITQNPLYAQVGLWGVLQVKADHYWQALNSYWPGQYNQIKEPLLASLFWPAFLVGLVACARYIRRWYVPLILCGLAIMVLPDLTQGDREWPHELRLTGAYPFIGAIAGLGVAGLWALFSRWRPAQRWVLVGAVAASAYVAGSQAYKFFSMDGNYGRMYYGGNVWFRRVDNSLAATMQADTRSYLIPLENYSETPIKYLLANRAPVLESALDANGNLKPALLENNKPVRVVLPRGGEDELWGGDPSQWVLLDGNHLYVLPPLDASAVTPLLPTQLDDSNALYGAGSNTVIRMGHYADETLGQWPLPKQVQPLFKTQTCFEAGMCVVGAAYNDSHLQPGLPLKVTLFWQVQKPVRDEYVMFVHLLDRDGNAIVGKDDYPMSDGVRTYEWRAGDLTWTQTTLELPANIKPGPYSLEVGFYLEYIVKRVDTVDEAGQPNGDRALLQNLKMARPVVQIPANATPTQIDFGDEVSLAAYRLDTLPDGTQPLRLSLWWRGLQPASVAWTEFFHLTPAADNTSLVGQLDHELTGGEYPPTLWDKDEVVEEQIEIQSGPLGAGQYDVWMGLYNPNTQERAPVLSGPGPTQDNRTRLLEFKVP